MSATCNLGKYIGANSLSCAGKYYNSENIHNCNKSIMIDITMICRVVLKVQQPLKDFEENSKKGVVSLLLLIFS